jgi:hypothetical protein
LVPGGGGVADWAVTVIVAPGVNGLGVAEIDCADATW